MIRKAGLRLSKKQLEILTALRRFCGEHGYVPSVRELAAFVERSATTVFQHLKALEKKGYLRSDGSAHGWHILDSDETENTLAVQDGGAEDGSATFENGSVTVVIRGSIAAGRPLDAVDDPDDTITVPAELARAGSYALRVRGRSMEDDHILDGDIIVVEPRDTVEDGTITVVLLEDGTATLKRIYRESKRIRLQPANAQMEPFYVSKVRVQGRVTGVIRRCR